MNSPVFFLRRSGRTGSVDSSLCVLLCVCFCGDTEAFFQDVWKYLAPVPRANREERKHARLWVSRETLADRSPLDSCINLGPDFDKNVEIFLLYAQTLALTARVFFWNGGKMKS